MLTEKLCTPIPPSADLFSLVSAACFEALGGIIGASGNDAAWSTCTDASGPTDVPTACQGQGLQ